MNLGVARTIETVPIAGIVMLTAACSNTVTVMWRVCMPKIYSEPLFYQKQVSVFDDTYWTPLMLLVFILKRTQTIMEFFGGRTWHLGRIKHRTRQKGEAL